MKKLSAIPFLTLLLLAPVTFAQNSQTSDPCLIAATRAVDQYEARQFALNNQGKPDDETETYGGTDDATQDDQNPALYHVEYSFNEECLAGARVLTHLSADGKSCQADLGSIAEDGNPDCG